MNDCMYGKATFIKVNQLRYDSLSQKYQGTSVQVLIALNGFPPCKALVFLLLAEYHLKHILKEPTIRNSYQFSNVPSHKWQNIFSICGSIFSIICTVLGNVSKRSLITSVKTVHGLDNQK